MPAGTRKAGQEGKHMAHVQRWELATARLGAARGKTGCRGLQPSCCSQTSDQQAAFQPSISRNRLGNYRMAPRLWSSLQTAAARVQSRCTAGSDRPSTLLSCCAQVQRLLNAAAVVRALHPHQRWQPRRVHRRDAGRQVGVVCGGVLDVHLPWRVVGQGRGGAFNAWKVGHGKGGGGRLCRWKDRT